MTPALWLAAAGSNPVLQAFAAAVATFVLEDPTTVAAGLLVADGRMAFLTAYVGLSAGIASGDLGLYLLGRLAGPQIVRRQLIDPCRFERARRWFDTNLILAMVVSRFVPGMRLPTYLSAGMLQAPVRRFILVAVAASMVWTFLLLQLTVAVGTSVLPLLGSARWPVAAAAVVLLVIIQRSAARHLDRREPQPRVLSRFELWPPWLFYLPVAAYYAWLAMRFRHPLVPTAANPSIYAGGLIGESKSAILDLVPLASRNWIARYVAVQKVHDIDEDAFRHQVLRAARDAALKLPFVVKPDIGQRGAGVRRIARPQELHEYLQQFPSGQRLIVQELVDEAFFAGHSHQETSPSIAPHLPVDVQRAQEAGVLYWRRPGSERGEIVSLTLKLFPEVMGNGRDTLAQLIDADPRARRLRRIYRARHASALSRVLADGETVPLVFAGNHCQGAVFKDGNRLMTDTLRQRIEEIAGSIPHFYFGRFDIRFSSLEAFLAGEGFRVVEINGAGAEATHIWDADARLIPSYRSLFHQFRTLFEIGHENRKQGFQPVTILSFLRDVLAYRQLAKAYPRGD